jgi:hypothetical protein
VTNNPRKEGFEMMHKPFLKKLGLIVVVVALVLSASQSACETGEHVFEASFVRTQYSDDDWNLMFYDNCGMPKSDSVRWIEKGNNKFIRFQLGDKDYGNCGSDRRARHGAPYWERAELKQTTGLNRNLKYELEFTVRFVEGYAGSREDFWQLHATSRNCNIGPPIMIKFDDGFLTLSSKREDGGSNKRTSSVKIDNLIGKWSNVKMKFDTSGNSEVSLSLDDKEVFSNIPYWVEPCGIPHFKFGIYRPGNKYKKNNRSVVDFDKIKLTEIKND